MKTEGRGRTVDEWKLRLAGMDNHLLDCLVGAAVGASILGAALYETGGKVAPKKTITAAEWFGRGRRRASARR